MKKWLHLSIPIIAACLFYILFDLLLITLPVSAHQIQIDSTESEIKHSPPLDGPTFETSLVGAQTVTNVVIIYNTSTGVPYTTFPINFTALINTATGTQFRQNQPSFVDQRAPIDYNWAVDGQNVTSSISRLSHTFMTAGVHTVTVWVIDGLHVVSDTKVLTVANAPYQVYLPIIMNGFTLYPDLVCTGLSFNPPDPEPGETFLITVDMKNQGQAQADGFWVDLYINPTRVPAAGDLFAWQRACVPDGTSNDDPETNCPLGVAWGISNNPLRPGIKRSLVSVSKLEHPNGYDPEYTQWTGSLEAGSYTFYAYVDSINRTEVETTTYGAIWEKDAGERNNRCGPRTLTIPAKAGKTDSMQSNSIPTHSSP